MSHALAAFLIWLMSTLGVPTCEPTQVNGPGICVYKPVAPPPTTGRVVGDAQSLSSISNGF